MSLWCGHCEESGEALELSYAKLAALLIGCVESLEGYRRNLNDGQPCDAEKAAREFLGLTDRETDAHE